MRGLVKRAGALALLGCAIACAKERTTTVAIPDTTPAAASLPEAAEPAVKENDTATLDAAAEEAPETALSAWTASRRGWLGVELEPADPKDGGVRILRVVPESPAANAGLQSGDLIVRLDNESVLMPDDVVAWVSRRSAGTRVSVMAKRSGQDRLVAVELGAFPAGDQLVRMTFVGQPAPPFEFLKTAQGSVSPTLGAQRGKVVVVEFWAPWCVACRALIPHMNQWHDQYAAQGLRVLGITNERLARAAAVASELGMEFSVLTDETGRTARLYQAQAIPTVFIIDRQGMVRDVMIGYDSRKLVELDGLVRQLLKE